MAGHVEQLLNNDFATHWGVAVTFQFNNVGGNALPYDATPHGIDGFKFTLSGNDVPDELRPRYRVDGQACLSSMFPRAPRATSTSTSASAR